MGEGSRVGPWPLQPQKIGVSFFLFNKSSSGDNDRRERQIFDPHFHKSVSTRALSYAAPPLETHATPLFVTQWSCADDGIGLLFAPPVPDSGHPPKLLPVLPPFKSVNGLFLSTALDFRRWEAFLQDTNKGDKDGDARHIRGQAAAAACPRMGGEREAVCP